ncbi:MAG: nitroreductase [Pseudomonadales bacterium]|nr:nitroreductase [Pseudomonadales bacterium]
MDALHALQHRVSSNRVGEQAPDDKVLHNIFQAALRAADHALLRPWRYLVIRGEARRHLGRLMVEATLADHPHTPAAKLESIASKPLRAPVIVVAISSPKPHPGVPAWEQEFSAAAAMQNMLTASFALNVGAIWRTGSMADNTHVMAGLGLQDAEKIIGFLYLGPLAGQQQPPPRLDVADYFTEWQ